MKINTISENDLVYTATIEEYDSYGSYGTKKIMFTANLDELPTTADVIAAVEEYLNKWQSLISIELVDTRYPDLCGMKVMVA